MVNLSIFYIWKDIKSACNNNKFKISVLTWNDKFDLHDGSYPALGIQNYFEQITEKHETTAGNSLVQIFTNKIKNRIVIKIRRL